MERKNRSKINHSNENWFMGKKVIKKKRKEKQILVYWRGKYIYIRTHAH